MIGTAASTIVIISLESDTKYFFLVRRATMEFALSFDSAHLSIFTSFSLFVHSN